MRRARWVRRLRSPAVQLAAAVVLMVAGAWLIAPWAIGLVLVAAGAGWAADAVLRDSGQPDRSKTSAHEDVLDRWRRAK